MNNTEKNIFNELLERGKQSGTLSTKEIYNVIDEADVDLDKLSEFLDQNNIKVDDDFNVEDDLNKALELSEAANEKGGTGMDDPVKIHLREIGSPPRRRASSRNVLSTAMMRRVTGSLQRICVLL